MRWNPVIKDGTGVFFLETGLANRKKHASGVSHLLKLCVLGEFYARFSQDAQVNETLIVCRNCVRETSVKRWNKIVQDYNAKCSKCFQFLCNNSDRTWFFNALTFTRSFGRCWKPQPPASVFNTSNRTWQMLMHEKPCLIPIISVQYHTKKEP